MRYLFIILQLFLVTLLGKAQVPGYMGKKIMIGLTYDYSLPIGSFMFENLGSGSFAKTILLPPPRLGLTLKYVYSDHKTLDFSYINQTFNPARSGFNNNGDYVESASSTAHIFNVGLSHHSLHVAPLGYYLTQGFSIVTINSNYKLQNSNVIYETPLAFDFGYNISMGTRRIIADKICLEAGVNFNFFAIGFFQLLNMSEEFGEPTTADIINTRAQRLNYFDNIASVRLGAGYLF
jgi:hypothetical protein